MVIVQRARAAAAAARGRLSAPQHHTLRPSEEPISPQEIAQLRAELLRNEKALARLRQRLKALEEEIAETRRIGLQVGHLGDLVTTLLARSASEADGEFSRELSTYADDF